MANILDYLCVPKWNLRFKRHLHRYKNKCAVVCAIPENESSSVITNDAYVGELLVVTPGVWTGCECMSSTFEFSADGTTEWTPFEGTEITEAQEGGYIRYTETCTSTSESSEPIGPIAGV